MAVENQHGDKGRWRVNQIIIYMLMCTATVVVGICLILNVVERIEERLKRLEKRPTNQPDAAPTP